LIILFIALIAISTDFYELRKYSLLLEVIRLPNHSKHATFVDDGPANEVMDNISRIEYSMLAHSGLIFFALSSLWIVSFKGDNSMGEISKELQTGTSPTS
jgi:hypothetical protein